jgi:RecA-family ATPase
MMCGNTLRTIQRSVDSRDWRSLPDLGQFAELDPEQVPKTKWLLESFLAEKSIQLVFGERGSFKSTLLLAAARAIADGEEFLGLKTRRHRVLYLDYENPADIIKARNDDLSLDLARNQNLKVWDRFGPQPTPRTDDPWLEAIVRECVADTSHGPWIIFDSFASLLYLTWPCWENEQFMD